MKSLFQLFLLTGVAGLALMGCEKHDFESTKVLHESHGGHHGEDHHGEHGDHKEDHGGHGDDKKGHDKKDHGEKHEEQKEEKKEAGEGRDVGLNPKIVSVVGQ